MHATTAAEIRALRETEQMHHEAANVSRGELLGRVAALEAKVEDRYGELDKKLDALLEIERAKAAEKAAKEALAKSLGFAFKIAGAVLAAATALAGFVKLIFEMTRHHKP